MTRPRPAITIHRAPRRLPWPTRLGWAVCLAILLAGLGVAVVRAQETPVAALAQAVLPATPTPEPEPPRYAPVSRGGRAAVQELAEAHFPPDWVAWAINTAWCESRWDLYAYSAGFDRRWGVFFEHIGAMQIDGVSWRQLAAGDILEPTVNFAVAAVVLARQGTSAWPACG